MYISNEMQLNCTELNQVKAAGQVCSEMKEEKEINESRLTGSSFHFVPLILNMQPLDSSLCQITYKKRLNAYVHLQFFPQSGSFFEKS